MRRISLILSFCFVARAFGGEAVWHPEKTWVFAVGVLEFDTKTLATWPDKGRVDAIMIDAYKKRGIPDDHITFIKNKDATKAYLVKSFNAFLAKIGADETLIFYYAGHGGRDYNDPKRASYFVTYDSKLGWTVSEVFDAVEKHYKGSQVLMTADCCHSGAIALEAEKRAGRINFGVLASAHATSRSTGAWTFTRCLVDMLEGNPMLDYDGNGSITFGEAARYCEEEMSFYEGQLSCSTAKGHFSTELVLAKTAASKKDHVGERCEAEDENKWWKVKVLDSKKGQVFVTWLGWDKKYDRWIDEKLLRPFKPATFPTGAAVEVDYDGKGYPSKIIQNKLGLVLIHYDGYPDIDDEWVAPDRIRMKK